MVEINQDPIYETMQPVGNTTPSSRRQTELLTKYLQCWICNNTVYNPKELPCHHSFCKTCLDEILCFKTDGNAVIACPKTNCGKEAVLSNEETTDDFATSEFIDLANTIYSDNESLDIRKGVHICSGKEGCDKKIAAYCQVCTSSFCKPCLNKHIDKHDDTPYKPVRLDKNYDLKGWCVQHAAYAKFICYQDNCNMRLICIYCKHRQHKDHKVKNIDIVSAEIKQRVNNLTKDTDLIRNQLIYNLKQRKAKCLQDCYTDLCNHEEILLKSFNECTSSEITEFSNQFSTKANVQIILDENLIDANLTNVASIAMRSSFDITLTDVQYRCQSPLGNLQLVNNNRSKSSFSAAIIPDITTLEEFLRKLEEDEIIKEEPADIENNPEEIIMEEPADIENNSEGVSAEESVHVCAEVSVDAVCSKGPVDVKTETQDALSDKERSEAAENSIRRGFSYVSLLINNGDITTLQFLLSKQQEIIHSMIEDRSGETPLHVCAGVDNVSIIELFKNTGAVLDVGDKFSNSILHKAAYHNAYNVLTWIMDVDKSFINSRNRSGETPLYVAARKGSERCVEILLRNGCDHTILDLHRLSAADAAKLKSEMALFNRENKKKYNKIVLMIKSM